MSIGCTANKGNKNEIETLKATVKELEIENEKLRSGLEENVKILVSYVDEHTDPIEEQESLYSDYLLFKNRYETHLEYILKHQSSNESEIDYPVLKGVGIGSNYIHVLNVFGEPNEVDHINGFKGLGIEIWLYDDIEIYFDKTEVTSIIISGIWVKELDCVIENNARRTIDYCSEKYDAYIPNNPDAPNNGWYEFGGGSVLIINIMVIRVMMKLY